MVRPSCEACGLDFSFADSADGPAFFAMSIVGVLTGFAALFVEVAVRPPIWVHLIVWLPLAVILSLLLLRPIKGVLVAFQYRHRAAEVRNEDF